MNSTSTVPVSLYELALQSESPPSHLQISPSTLKTMTDGLVSLLIDHKISAVIWAKLPRGTVWRTELEHYLQLDLAQAVYSFSNYREDGEEAGDGVTTLGDQSADNSTSGVLNDFSSTPLFPIQLPPDSALRRDYFLIVWSDQFQGGVLAQRSRSPQPPKPETVALDLLSGYGHVSQLVEPPPDRKQILLATYSFNSQLLQRSLQALESIANQAPDPRLLESNVSTATPANSMVEHWQTLLAAMPAIAPNPALIEQLFSQHLQQQEDFSQRAAALRKQADQAESLKAQNDEMVHTLRLKDDFLNNVGQELRTPLTTIKTALSLLASPALKPPQRQRYMDLIAKECDRQSSLITSLLDLVQLDQSADQTALPPVRMCEVVPGVVSTYQPVAEEKGVRLSYTIPEDLPAVACMTNWLKQIVINLLHNGIKYTPAGGQVWVRAKQQGDYVQLEVKDTGIGIAPGEIPKIFDRFYRVRQSADESSGAGLGLTIVQQLLLHCGGSISVKSRLAEGSTFNVLLPIYRSPSEQGF